MGLNLGVCVCVHARVHMHVLTCFSRVLLLATPWTVAYQAPPHGILQARILEWVATPSSRGSSPPRDGALVSHVSRIGRQVLYH